MKRLFARGSKNFRLENEAKACGVPSFLGPLLALLALLPTFVSPFAATAAKPQARVAQLVERDLAKVEVASSNLVSRSKNRKDVATQQRPFCFKESQYFIANFEGVTTHAGVVEWYTRVT